MNEAPDPSRSAESSAVPGLISDDGLWRWTGSVWRSTILSPPWYFRRTVMIPLSVIIPPMRLVSTWGSRRKSTGAKVFDTLFSGSYIILSIAIWGALAWFVTGLVWALMFAYRSAEWRMAEASRPPPRPQSRLVAPIVTGQPTSASVRSTLAPPQATTSIDTDVISRLKQMADLHAAGTLTDAEFDSAKASLLGRL